MKPAGWFFAALSAAAVIGLSACGASCDSTARVAGMPVIAAGSFDAVATDQGAHRLYLADRVAQGVDVVDIGPSTPRFVGTVVLGAGANGLAVAPEQHRVYAAVEGGNIAVIDSRTLAVLSTTRVDPTSADLVDYSPATRSLYVGSGNDVVVLDTTNQVVSRRITAPSPLEQPRYDPADGKLYVTAPKMDSLLQFDPATGKVTRTYVLPKCHPTGLAINPSRQLAMLACGSSIGFVNLRSGASAVTQKVQGGDIATYDPGADRFIVASPHDSGSSAIGVFTGDGTFVGSVSALPTVHGAAFDDAHGVVYAPGKGGLMSFAPAACAAPPDWVPFLAGLSLFVVPMLAAAAFLLYVAWRRDHPRVAPSGPTYEQLVEEDLTFERERMHALEDGIFGPEVAP